MDKTAYIGLTAGTANSLTCHCALERDRIPPLKGYGQTLEQKCGFLWLLGDDGDASADILH